MSELPAALLSLSPHEARAATAIFERMFPADELGPGAAEIGVVVYLDRALAGPYRQHAEAYRVGLATLDQIAHALNAAGKPVSFMELSAPHGHDSFLLDVPALDRVIEGFLGQ